MLTLVLLLNSLYHVGDENYCEDEVLDIFVQELKASLEALLTKYFILSAGCIITRILRVYSFYLFMIDRSINLTYLCRHILALKVINLEKNKWEFFDFHQIKSSSRIAKISLTTISPLT